VYQNLPDSFLQYIKTTYHWSLSSGKIPTSWSTMKTVFIPKIGKNQFNVPKAFRPITLSSFMLKALERILQWYIKDAHTQTPLYAQHAYTEGLSTETALSAFINEVESALHRGQYTLAVSLDCSGAFDRISFDSATEALREQGTPESIIRWYSNVLRNRARNLHVGDVD